MIKVITVMISADIITIIISDTVLLVGGEVDNYLHPAIANVEVW